MITITKHLSIPNDEVLITASRSGGPGGQNVNKVNTRVTLHFSVCSSKVLTDAQKAKITTCLKSRMTKDGVLYLHAQGSRSQSANRTILLDRFVILLREALTPVKPRKETKVPKSVIEQRLKQKKQRSRLKKIRRQLTQIED